MRHSLPFGLVSLGFRFVGEAGLQAKQPHGVAAKDFFFVAFNIWALH
jgi:hypothetical protein